MKYIIIVASVIAAILTGCTFYTPSRSLMVIEMRHDEAYYAGFFRACEMLIRSESGGIYSYVQSSHTSTEPRNQCPQLTQQKLARGGQVVARDADAILRSD